MTVAFENVILGWFYKFQNTFLTGKKSLRLLIFMSKLYTPIQLQLMKKKIPKKSYLALKWGMLLALALSALLRVESILERYSGD